MPRMIDLIRASAVPATLVQSAARGGLAIPSQEMLEILVYLATENKVFGEQAQLTLAGWDEAYCRTAASNPGTSKTVLSYFSAPQHFRPALFPALLANPEVPEESLAELAASISRDFAGTMLSNDRAIHSEQILTALASNPNLNGIQSATIDEHLSLLTNANAVANVTSESETTQQSSSQTWEAQDKVPPEQPSQEDQETDEKVTTYIAEHATEIAASADKPFQPVGGIYEETAAEAAPQADSATAPPVMATSSDPTSATLMTGTSAAAGTKMAAATSPVAASQKRGSALQKISTLGVSGRIQLAMKGSKEERSLLIRDGTKIVSLAVLDSPKISDGEVEKFASQKNVLEAVLRAIPMKRRYMKNYNIVRNLVFNPRTPIDVSLTLMKNILVADLKNLSGNKEVSETVRKSALRQFKQKLSADK